MVTPTLTHSPSSTESSSGDRTIQMASFLDEPHASLGGSGCFVQLQDHKVSPPVGDGFASNPYAALYAPTNLALVFSSEKYCVAHHVGPHMEAITSDFRSHLFTQ